MQDRLTKLARGRECTVRIPGVCNHDPDTVVLAHIRMVDISGFGIKANSLFGAYSCHACHMVADGQVPSEYTHDERRLMLLEGMVRTQAILIKEGKIKT